MFLFGLEFDNSLGNISCSFCPCSLCPTLSANPQIRPRLLRVLGGRRLRARGKKVFHRELARVSTGVSVWIWAELVFADPVTFGSPVFVIFFLVEEIPFSWFSQKISYY